MADYISYRVTGPVSIQRLDDEYKLSGWRAQTILLLGPTGTGKSRSVTMANHTYDRNALPSDKVGIEYILYFHRINDKRVSGTQRKTLELVKALLGSPRQYTTMGAITTMWDTLWLPEQINAAEERYAELIREYIGVNILGYSHLTLQESALHIINKLLENRNPLHGFQDPPLFRNMMSPGPDMLSTFRKTQVALPLYNLLLQRIEEVQQQLHNIDDDIKNEQAAAGTGSNEELLQVLSKNKADAEAMLAELERERMEFGEPPQPVVPSVGLITHRFTHYFKNRVSQYMAKDVDNP
ncbi:hypothetical protein CVT24_006373 [Panaeolus cyanescens]|uniref:Uncharacterized protein n=1 Tax=Panaeolus cyanescens TaxID=181874 RepID=A0A409YE53_9AGAR|nr:hypothetical protein CVT24_006373 [Panaeolus cyanescens]